MSSSDPPAVNRTGATPTTGANGASPLSDSLLTDRPLGHLPLTDWPLVVHALDFAARKHRNQRRKDRARSPYINHPIDVLAALVLEAGITDSPVLAAALLHDTLEDTDTAPDELIAAFGLEIANIVAEVTDDKRLPKAERKRRQIAHAPTLSDRAKLVKLADKLCNLRDVHQSPPIHWSIERRRAYFDWAENVVMALGSTNQPLTHALRSVLSAGRNALDREQVQGAARRLYWAGPLFSVGERWFNQALSDRLRAAGYQVFLPQAECAGLTETAAIFERCRLGLQQADGVIAVLDGADADSGTCWECGYAFAQKLPIVAIRTDFRASGDSGGFNAMLLASAQAVVTLADPTAVLSANLDSLAQDLLLALNTIGLDPLDEPIVNAPESAVHHG